MLIPSLCFPYVSHDPYIPSNSPSMHSESDTIPSVSPDSDPQSNVRVCITVSPSPRTGLFSHGPTSTSIVFGLSGTGDPVPISHRPSLCAPSSPPDTVGGRIELSSRSWSDALGLHHAQTNQGHSYQEKIRRVFFENGCPSKKNIKPGNDPWCKMK